MKPEIGFMGLLSRQNVLDDLLFAVDNGFDWFELPLDWKQNFNLSDHIVEKIGEVSVNHGIRLIIHTPYYLPTSCLLSEIRQGVIENVKKAIYLATRVNSDRITIHPGYREMPSVANDLCIQSLVHTLNQIMALGSEFNVHICLENFGKNELVLCGELSELLKVVNSVQGLKVTLDVGHSNITEKEPWEFFVAVKNLVMNMHVHDNRGEIDEHKCPTEGKIDFIRLFSECKKAKYSGPFILETFPYDKILKGKKVLSELWERA